VKNKNEKLAGDVLRRGVLIYCKETNQMQYEVTDLDIVDASKDNMAVKVESHYENIGIEPNVFAAYVMNQTKAYDAKLPQGATVMAVMYTQDLSDVWIYNKLREAIVDHIAKPELRDMVARIRSHKYTVGGPTE
jgi:hypothetical protein